MEDHGPEEAISVTMAGIEGVLEHMSTLSPTSENADYSATRMESIRKVLDELLQDYPENLYAERLLSLRSRVIHLQLTWTSNLAVTRSCTEPAVIGSTRQCSGRGRPKVHLNTDQVELLRSSGYTWTEVADVLMISRTTLWRRVRESGIVMNSFSDVSDHELDTAVRTFRRRHPHSGQVMTHGYLNSIGIRVQRYRLRGSIARVDPLGSLLHRRQPITRRRYSVPGPNSLWHIDGHHSLIRWGFVVHGGVDGFSRLIVYLYCSTNNRASTVTQLFLRACSLFGVPSRVRSDRGGENVGVCEYMITTRGTDRGSHIAGPSTHNQRIERLWRDVFRCVCSTFHGLFHYLEEVGELDPECLCDIYTLQSIFVPRINLSLTEFACAWNHHPLRTERSWSPKKIWMNGVLHSGNQDFTAVRDIFEDVPAEGLESFGQDPGGPLPHCIEEVCSTVTVNSPSCPLSEEDEAAFLDTFDPLSLCEDYGIALYTAAREFVHAHSTSGNLTH